VWSVTAEPQKFDEAVAWFADRFPITDDLSEALGDYTGPRAWKIAGVAQLEVVQFVHDSLERAIASGIPFDEWQKEVEDELTKAWGRKDSARMQTIFINANQQSYNAGRWEQMTDPTVLSLRPFGMFDAVDDAHTTKEICKPLDGTILPLEQFEERGLCPQLHHRCRSGIRSLRESDANRRGGVTQTVPNAKPSEGFGAAPTVADWQPERSKYDPKIWNEYERKAADLESSPRRLAKTG
jgi:SPP1 gp7 family putative phage head morphogenesis protein